MNAAGTGGCALPAVPALGDPALTATYEPKWDSPLLDHGDPHALILPRTTDLDGNGRIVGPVIDIGAFEYQRRAPSVTGATVAQAPAGVDVPFAVAKASDPDPGDTLTFTWTFDDGASAAGAQVTHQFASPGAHAGTVTAVDPTGLSATSTVTVAVFARAVQPSAHRPARKDTTPPRITKLKLKKTHISFTLSEPAKLKLTFERRVGKHYRKLSGTISHTESKAGAHALHFSGRVGKHRLRHGRYRLALTATDASGNRSKAARATFRIK